MKEILLAEGAYLIHDRYRDFNELVLTSLPDSSVHRNDGVRIEKPVGVLPESTVFSCVAHSAR